MDTNVNANSNTNGFSFKGFKALLIVVLVIVIAGAGISTATLFMFINHANETKEEEGTKENDVTIAGQYVIRSTEQISDAYKSGKTDNLSDRDKETLDMAVAAMDEFLKDGMSDYEKEKAAYDWITDTMGQDRGLLTVIPSSGADSDNPYGALKYHNAVCVGYATTFRLFMQMMDIPCMVVHETGLYHSWNLVQIDGDWYHVDCYSGAGNSGYQYFNMTDDMCTQSWDRSFFPAANSYKHNIAYQSAIRCRDIYQIPARIRTALDDNESSISLRFNKNLTEAEAQLASEMCTQIEQRLWNSEDYSEVYMYWNWIPTDDCYLFVINISNSANSDEDATISDEQREQADQSIEEAFPDMAADEEYDTDYTIEWMGEENVEVTYE